MLQPGNIRNPHVHLLARFAFPCRSTAVDILLRCCELHKYVFYIEKLLSYHTARLSRVCGSGTDGKGQGENNPSDLYAAHSLKNYFRGERTKPNNFVAHQ